MVGFISDKLNKAEDKRKGRKKEERKEQKEKIPFFSWRVVFLGFDFS